MIEIILPYDHCRWYYAWRGELKLWQEEFHKGIENASMATACRNGSDNASERKRLYYRRSPDEGTG